LEDASDLTLAAPARPKGSDPSFSTGATPGWRSTDVPAPPDTSPPAKPSWVRRHRPALVMVGLSILIPELLTGSTPVAGLLNPVADLFLLGLYGGGVLVIREVGLRWNRGWGPVLLLGAAYGIVEEGLGTKTFFDPTLIGGAAAGMPHWLGVNWVWSAELSVFHAAFSIALPILITGLLFPESRKAQFLSIRGVVGTFLLFLLTVTLMFFLFDRTYALPPAILLGTFVAIALLVGCAWRIPSRWIRPRHIQPSATSSASFWAASGFVWGFFAINTLGAGLVRFPPVIIAGSVLLTALFLRWGMEHLGTGGNERQLVYLTSGLLAFLFIFVGVFGTIGGDYAAFLAILVAVYLLRRLANQYPSRQRSTVPPGALASS
jgi:hypothetical protein